MEPTEPDAKLCAEDGCLAKAEARGRCESHYRQLRLAERREEAYGVTEERVLEVARRHGTTAAAEWAGWSTSRVRALRRRVGDTLRGRGHPTRAEIEAAKPRLDCDCTRCACWRSEQASAGNHRHGSISRLLDHWAVDRVVLGRLQRDGACAEHPTELWFPSGRGPSSDWDTPRAICDTCQVRADCLAYALERSIPHGMFGGLTPHERSKLTAEAGGSST